MQPRNIHCEIREEDKRESILWLQRYSNHLAILSVQCLIKGEDYLSCQRRPRSKKLPLPLNTN